MTIDNPQHFLSMRKIFALVFVIISLPLLLHQILFRGVYLPFLEPKSTAGMTLLARSMKMRACDISHPLASY
jgi:hypothetical protein